VVLVRIFSLTGVRPPPYLLSGTGCLWQQPLLQERQQLRMQRRPLAARLPLSRQLCPQPLDLFLQLPQPPVSGCFSQPRQCWCSAGRIRAVLSMH
jgi:hypothetical protein